jgi:hypothetical protein
MPCRQVRQSENRDRKHCFSCIMYSGPGLGLHVCARTFHNIFCEAALPGSHHSPDFLALACFPVPASCNYFYTVSMTCDGVMSTHLGRTMQTIVATSETMPPSRLGTKTKTLWMVWAQTHNQRCWRWAADRAALLSQLRVCRPPSG